MNTVRARGQLGGHFWGPRPYGLGFTIDPALLTAVVEGAVVTATTTQSVVATARANKAARKAAKRQAKKRAKARKQADAAAREEAAYIEQESRQSPQRSSTVPIAIALVFVGVLGAVLISKRPRGRAALPAPQRGRA